MKKCFRIASYERLLQGAQLATLSGRSFDGPAHNVFGNGSSHVTGMARLPQKVQTWGTGWSFFFLAIAFSGPRKIKEIGSTDLIDISRTVHVAPAHCNSLLDVTGGRHRVGGQLHVRAHQPARKSITSMTVSSDRKRCQEPIDVPTSIGSCASPEFQAEIISWRTPRRINRRTVSGSFSAIRLRTSTRHGASNSTPSRTPSAP